MGTYLFIILINVNILSQVSASGESQYDDAFTIQLVEDDHVHEFNYVAGCVPFFLNLIRDVCVKHVIICLPVSMISDKLKK